MSAKKVVRMVSTPITLVILLGLLTAGLWWGYKSVTARVVQTTTPCVTMSMTELTTSSVTVTVYNSGSLSGLAARVSDVLAGGGFLMRQPGNSDNNVQTVMIMGANADDPEVQLVAAWFVEPVIQADGRASHTVDVYVGNSFDETTGMIPDAPRSLQIPTGEVCLPASGTPTPVPGDEPVDGPPVPGTEPGEAGEAGAEPAGEPAAEEPAAEGGTQPEEPAEAPVLGPPAPEEPN